MIILTVPDEERVAFQFVAQNKELLLAAIQAQFALEQEQLLQYAEERKAAGHDPDTVARWLADDGHYLQRERDSLLHLVQREVQDEVEEARLLWPPDPFWHPILLVQGAMPLAVPGGALPWPEAPQEA